MRSETRDQTVQKASRPDWHSNDDGDHSDEETALETRRTIQLPANMLMWGYMGGTWARFVPGEFQVSSRWEWTLKDPVGLPKCVPSLQPTSIPHGSHLGPMCRVQPLLFPSLDPHGTRGSIQAPHGHAIWVINQPLMLKSPPSSFH